MPTVTLNRKVFERLVGKRLPEEKLRERISMLGTDLESISQSEIFLEIFPNRPDCLSEQGFARAFSSFIGEKTGLRGYVAESSGEKVIIDRSVSGVRPYTACAIVRGLSVDDDMIREIVQLQEKLHITYGRKRKKAAIGIYPYDKIKPPIRFIAKKPEDIVFRPLEFPKVLNGRHILGQHPAGREYGHLLEGMKKYPVFVDSSENLLSMPPIINSHVTGKITESTKDVFIECSGFDFDVLHKCLNMIVTALHDMGGRIYTMELLYPDRKRVTPDLRPGKVKFSRDYINRRLGLNLTEKQVKALLERMGYGYERGTALVPCYRADILHQIDIAEDIAIAYGYENFDAVIPNVATTGMESRIERFREKLTESLIGLGLIEVNTYNLTGKREQTELMCCKGEPVELANSLSADYNVLRFWVIPSLMEVLKNNKHRSYPQEIFGYGTIFRKDKKQETGVIEHERLCVMLSEDGYDFTKIRQYLDYLMRSSGIEYSVKETEHPSFIPGRVGRVFAGKRKVGYIGELSPEVITRWGLEMPVVAFEINITELMDELGDDFLK